jgi:hypothetical protein
MIDNVDPTESLREYILKNFSNEYLSITIGSSKLNTKTIKSDYIGNLYFVHQYKDTFKYTCENGHITITRTDINKGWGQNLVAYKKIGVLCVAMITITFHL